MNPKLRACCAIRDFSAPQTIDSDNCFFRHVKPRLGFPPPPMKRSLQGRYLKVATAGESFNSFVPAPLPPRPAIDWTPTLRGRFDAALVALGRLDAVTDLLPNAALLLYSFVRKETVLSSMIEGTQSSLADLMLFELDEQPGVPLEDAREVSRYVAALEHGLRRLSAVAAAAPRSTRRADGRPRARRQTHAGRVSQQPGLDRRHAAGQRGVRAASSQRNR